MVALLESDICSGDGVQIVQVGLTDAKELVGCSRKGFAFRPSTDDVIITALVGIDLLESAV